MDFVLTFSLILAFLSIGQSYPAEQTSKCYDECPPGYHKEGDCVDPAAKHSCKKCEAGTYTAIPNFIPECLRCDSCGRNQKEIKPCSNISNVVCGCKEGFYADSGKHDGQCLQCPNKDCKGDKKNCQNWTCLSTTPTNQHPDSTTMHPSTTSNGTPLKKPVTDNSVGYLPLMFAILIAVVVFCGATGVLMKLCGDSDNCSCCGMNKDLAPAEDCFNEQPSHQGCSLTTMTFNISEETPMMTFSQSPGHPAHINPPVPDTKHKAPPAARQKDQSEHWPAIVLYTIIREVPVRRWKEFLRLLSVADQQLERVEMEASTGLGFTERQYQMLRLWSQQSSASLSDIFTALHNMDLSGCAQLLQESLEKLQWRPEPMQGVTACRGYAASVGGAMQDT